MGLSLATAVGGAGRNNARPVSKYASTAEKNVTHLRAEPPVLRWMGDRAQPPKSKNQTILEGGATLGQFWANCKYAKRCTRSPYDRLLTNPVLRADYRTTNERPAKRLRIGSLTERTRKNVDHLRAEPPALRWMRDRRRAPKSSDQTVLDGGVKVGMLWIRCKTRVHCITSPYDRLLANTVLRADYRHHQQHERYVENHKHERITKKQKRLGIVRAGRVEKNVDHLRIEPPALRWMKKRVELPKYNDQTALDGGTKLGIFWVNCKRGRRCSKQFYDRLLTNPVLRADYRTTAAARPSDINADTTESRWCAQRSILTDLIIHSGVDGRQRTATNG